MKYLDDILIILGEALVIIGSYLIDPVAALFTAGIILVIDGVLVGASRSKA